MKTKARRYALPDKHHDVVEDIEALRETIRKIDSDLSEIVANTDNIQNVVEEASPRVLKVEKNGELKNIAADRFISFCDGNFVCTNSLLNNSKGHGGQCTINSGDSGRAWIDINNASAIDGNGSEIHIFNGENEAKIRNEGELVNIQATADFVCENNESIILRNEQEEIVESLNLASQTSNGFVKIADGFEIEDGALSKLPIPMATHETAGLVILGDGFENKNDEICYNNLASLNNFGVIKLSRDFYLEGSGGLLIKRENPNIIYDFGRRGSVICGNVDVFEDTVHYFMVVHENTLIKIDINFEPKTDFSFILEVVSDGRRKLVFDDDFDSGLKEYVPESGRTYFEITKKIGVPKYGAVIYAKGTHFNREGFIRKIPYLRSDKDKGYTVTASSTHSELYMPYHAFDDDLFQRWSSKSEPTYPQWVQLKLPTAQAFTKIRLTTQEGDFLERMPVDFQVEGSNDGSTWTTLLEVKGAKWQTLCESQIFSLNNTKTYLYYRFVANANGGNQFQVSHLSFRKDLLFQLYIWTTP